jgi:hypothetical protein
MALVYYLSYVIETVFKSSLFLISGIQLLECPQQFNQMTLMLQRFDRVPDTEARMRLDKKIITPLCVSQSIFMIYFLFVIYKGLSV